MAEQEDIIFNTKVNTGPATTSVKSLKAELRSVTNELGSLEEGSAAFIKAAQRAGALKDKIGDIRDTVAAFNPEAKFQAFAGVIGGVANGFAVAQGAMALFGTENKDIEKAILKTQGAIAIATGLNGLMGMKDQLNILALVIKTNVVAAFATLRTSLITTGIGALVVALGILVSKWIAVKDATEAAAEATKKYEEEARKISESESKRLENSLSGRAQETYKINQEYDKQIKDLDKSLNDQTITRTLWSKELFRLEEERQKKIDEISNKYEKDRDSKVKEAADKQKALDEKRKAELKKAHDYELALKKSLTLAGQEEVADKKRQDEEDEKNRKARNASLILSRQEEAQAKQADALADIELAKKVEEQRILSLQLTSNALMGFAQLAGQQTALGKGLAVASTTIDTYVAAQAAFTSAMKIPGIGLALAPIAAAGAIAAGLARVQAILAVKVPGSSGSAPSIPMGGASTPPIIRPSSNMVHINDNAGPIKTKNDPGMVKVYVTETDITRVQNKVNSTQQKATIKG